MSLTKSQKRNIKIRLISEAMGYLELAYLVKQNISVTRALTNRAYNTIEKVSDDAYVKICILESILEEVQKNEN